MIVKQVAAGAKTAGLLAYLYGPGVGEARGGTVHVNPRTVASWDGQPSVHSPKQLTSGRRSVGGLARSLDAPVALVTKAPAKHVGHIVVANHPDAVRWIAVRHDDTSIHIAYTKVRESGRVAGYVNYTRAWEALRHEWEERLGLVPTGKADGTARRPYGQAEAARAKAAQHAGVPDARPDTAELRQLCRVIALEAGDVDTYFGRLRSAGVTVRAELDSEGKLIAYRVGLRARADGTPVLYAAARLDPALAVDALNRRWRATKTPTELKTDGPPSTTPVPTGRRSVGSSDLEDVLRLAADTTRDPAFFDAAETYSSAGRRAASTSIDSARRSAAHTAHQLRATSALLGTLARLDPASGRRVEAAELALAIASLLAERAAWHEQQLDLAGAHAIRRARRGVLVLTTGSSSLRRDDGSYDRIDPVQFQRPTGRVVPPSRRS